MIAGGGFAVMAWRLAQDRRWFKSFFGAPLERDELGSLDGPSTEYYRILDSAWEAWHQPQLLSIADAGIPVTVRL